MSLKKHTVWNLVGSGLPLLVALLFIPYSLKHLGAEAFGVLTLIWSLIGYFSLFDFGVGRALTYEISNLVQTNRQSEICTALMAGSLVTFFTGIIGGTGIFFLSHPLSFNWLKIDPGWQADAQLSFQIAGFGVIFTTLTSGFRGTQEALGSFGFSNINRIFLGSCMFFMPAFSIWMHGPHIWIITIYLVCSRIVVFFLSCIQLRKYLLVKINYKKIANYIKPLISFGGWVSVSGVISPMMVYGDRFFIGTLVGAASLSIYAIPQEALQRILILPDALTRALLPRIVGINKSELKASYLLNVKRITWFMFLVCFSAALLAYPGFSIWISKEFAASAMPIVMILSLGIWLNSIAMVPYTFLHSAGDTKITALIHILEVGIYFLMLYSFVYFLGLPGAALAWTFRVGIDLFLLRLVMRRIL